MLYGTHNQKVCHTNLHLWAGSIRFPKATLLLLVVSLGPHGSFQPGVAEGSRSHLHIIPPHASSFFTWSSGKTSQHPTASTVLVLLSSKIGSEVGDSPPLRRCFPHVRAWVGVREGRASAFSPVHRDALNISQPKKKTIRAEREH